MKQKFLLFTICCLIAYKLYGQNVSYSGFIGTEPIELVMDVSSDIYNAFYVYTQGYETVRLEGSFYAGRLNLIEKDCLRQNKATLFFNNFTDKEDSIKGTWTHLKPRAYLPIKLKKKI